MERAEVAVHPASEGIIVTTNGVLTECSICNATKKSRRDRKVFISHYDNLWEWSDWENEVNKKIQEGSQVDDKSRVLPEELVEKILSMVPFPYVFKARVLSKSWLARLSPISSQDDVEEKRRAILFQKHIRQWSPNWKVFCPVHDFSVHDLSDNNLLAYDRSSHSWQRLPSLSFLNKAPCYGPVPFIQMKCDEGGFLLMEGALLLWVVEDELYVANILTREWKQLPPRPYQGKYWARLSFRNVSFHHTFENYKVIVFSIGPSYIQDQFPECDDFIQIYDSATASWSHVMAATYIDTYCFDAVGGLFYFVEYDYLSFSMNVKSLNINEETLVKEPVTVAEVDLRGVAEVGLRGRRFLEAYAVICSTNLLIVIVYLYKGPHLVVKIDPRRKELLGVSDYGFPDYPETEGLDPISDGDYIFAEVEIDGSGVFAYNIHADQWELLPYCMESDHHKMWEGWVKHHWCTGWHEPYWHSFRPGLNPFAAV